MWYKTYVRWFIVVRCMVLCLPLQASEPGRWDIIAVNALFGNDCSIDAQKVALSADTRGAQQHGSRVLWNAVRNECPQMVKALLDIGVTANTSLPVSLGSWPCLDATPLTVAICNEQQEMVRMLLPHSHVGKDCSGFSPVAIAAGAWSQAHHLLSDVVLWKRYRQFFCVRLLAIASIAALQQYYMHGEDGTRYDLVLPFLLYISFVQSIFSLVRMPEEYRANSAMVRELLSRGVPFPDQQEFSQFTPQVQQMVRPLVHIVRERKEVLYRLLRDRHNMPPELCAIVGSFESGLL